MRLVEWHFWLAAPAVLLYSPASYLKPLETSIWAYGSPDHLGFLRESASLMRPYYSLAADIPITLGALVMAYNLWKTVSSQPAKVEDVPARVHPVAAR